MTDPRQLSVLVISITTFDDHGRLDEPALRQHLDRMAEAGIGVYLGGSGSGEGYSLSPREADRVLEIGVEQLGGKVSVRAMGVEPRSAAEAIERNTRAAAIGVDGVQVYALDMGHGRAPRLDEARHYYAEVLAALEVPSYLSVHQHTGQLLSVSLIAELLERFPLLAGINCTTNDLRYLVELLAVTQGRAQLHVGGAEPALTGLALGADGYLVSEGNVAPRLCMSVVERWAAGDLAGAASAYRRLLQLVVALQRHGGVTGTKAVLTALGLPGGAPRPPRLGIPDEWVTELVEAVDRLGIADVEGWGTTS